MTPEEITKRIAELETEILSIDAAFNVEKARVEQIVRQAQQGWQQYGTKAQQEVQHREGAVIELRKVLETLKGAQPPEPT